ncbi:hypothetical protein BDW22DRAFT_1468117 [Trametopsis cervina]|nr:hypothetical protein BDW22DRAFT_1468117 [Trametopsis cervina]
MWVSWDMTWWRDDIPNYVTHAHMQAPAIISEQQPSLHVTFRSEDNRQDTAAHRYQKVNGYVMCLELLSGGTATRCLEIRDGSEATSEYKRIQSMPRPPAENTATSAVPDSEDTSRRRNPGLRSQAARSTEQHFTTLRAGRTTPTKGAQTPKIPLRERTESTVQTSPHTPPASQAHKSAAGGVAEFARQACVVRTGTRMKACERPWDLSWTCRVDGCMVRGQTKALFATPPDILGLLAPAQVIGVVVDWGDVMRMWAPLRLSQAERTLGEQLEHQLFTIGGG